MAYHKAHVKLLGNQHAISSQADEAKNTPGAMSVASDFTDKYSPTLPNGTVQSEYYGQDERLSMEGRNVASTPENNNPEDIDSTKQQTEFYSALSDEKRQDGNVVYSHILYAAK